MQTAVQVLSAKKVTFCMSYNPANRKLTSMQIFV